MGWLGVAQWRDPGILAFAVVSAFAFAFLVVILSAAKNLLLARVARARSYQPTEPPHQAIIHIWPKILIPVSATFAHKPGITKRMPC